VLTCVCIICCPSDNSRRLSYASQLPTDDPGTVTAISHATPINGFYLHAARCKLLLLPTSVSLTLSHLSSLRIVVSSALFTSQFYYSLPHSFYPILCPLSPFITLSLSLPLLVSPCPSSSLPHPFPSPTFSLPHSHPHLSLLHFSADDEDFNLSSYPDDDYEGHEGVGTGYTDDDDQGEAILGSGSKADPKDGVEMVSTHVCAVREGGIDREEASHRVS
jgi:hypothetical protein